MLACGTFTGSVVSGSYSEPADDSDSDDDPIIGPSLPPSSSGASESKLDDASAATTDPEEAKPNILGQLRGVLRPTLTHATSWEAVSRWVDERAKFAHGEWSEWSE
jgi:hypothetical protein